MIFQTRIFKNQGQINRWTNDPENIFATFCKMSQLFSFWKPETVYFPNENT